jgi:uncharacterized protein YcfJ
MYFPTRTRTFAVACVGLALLAGCEAANENKRTTGAAIGAGAGALAGSAIAGKGQKTEGAVIGGALGAGGGWLAGDQIDKNDKDNRDRRVRTRDRYDDDYDSRGRDYDRF